MDVSPPSSISFEEHRWKEHAEILRSELALKRRELELREIEIGDAKGRIGLSNWTSPLVVSILTVALTGILNVGVVWYTNNGQTELEGKKHEYQLRVEADKSTRDMLSNIIQTADQAELCRRMKAAHDIKYTDTPAFVSAIQVYLQQQCQRPAVVTPPGPAVQPLPRKVEQWASDWLGGGNNQGDQCKVGLGAIQSRNPGKSVVVTGSSEQSRKDFFGRVSYKYFCNFDVIG